MDLENLLSVRARNVLHHLAAERGYPWPHGLVDMIADGLLEPGLLLERKNCGHRTLMEIRAFKTALRLERPTLPERHDQWMSAGDWRALADLVYRHRSELSGRAHTIVEDLCRHGPEDLEPLILQGAEVLLLKASHVGGKSIVQCNEWISRGRRLLQEGSGPDLYGDMEQWPVALLNRRVNLLDAVEFWAMYRRMHRLGLAADFFLVRESLIKLAEKYPAVAFTVSDCLSFGRARAKVSRLALQAYWRRKLDGLLALALAVERHANDHPAGSGERRDAMQDVEHATDPRPRVSVFPAWLWAAIGERTGKRFQDVLHIARDVSPAKALLQLVIQLPLDRQPKDPLVETLLDSARETGARGMGVRFSTGMVVNELIVRLTEENREKITDRSLRNLVWTQEHRYEGNTLQEIAHEAGLSRERIRQVTSSTPGLRERLVSLGAIPTKPFLWDGRSGEILYMDGGVDKGNPWDASYLSGSRKAIRLLETDGLYIRGTLAGDAAWLDDCAKRLQEMQRKSPLQHPLRLLEDMLPPEEPKSVWVRFLPLLLDRSPSAFSLPLNATRRTLVLQALEASDRALSVTDLAEKLPFFSQSDIRYAIVNLLRKRRITNLGRRGLYMAGSAGSMTFEAVLSDWVAQRDGHGPWHLCEVLDTYRQTTGRIANAISFRTTIEHEDGLRNQGLVMLPWYHFAKIEALDENLAAMLKAPGKRRLFLLAKREGKRMPAPDSQDFSAFVKGKAASWSCPRMLVSMVLRHHYYLQQSPYFS